MPSARLETLNHIRLRLSLRLAVADADFIARLQEAGGVERLRALAQCDVLQIVQVANACLHNVSEALATAASKTAKEAKDRRVATEAKAAAAAASREAARSGVALAEAEATREAVPVMASPRTRRRVNAGAVTLQERTFDGVHEITIDLSPPSTADLNQCVKWWRWGWPWRRSIASRKAKPVGVAVLADEDRFPVPRQQGMNEAEGGARSRHLTV